MLDHQSQLAEKVTIREHQLDDDPAYARLISMVMAAPYDVPLLRERRERWSQKDWHVRMAEVGGQVVGVMELTESGKPGVYRLRIIVDPDHRGRGIGSELLAAAKEHKGYHQPKVFSEVRDNDPQSRLYVEKNGFRLKGHTFESTINPQEFKLDKFQPYVDRVLNMGLRIATMAELRDTEENRFKLWEIEHVTDKDIPGLDMDELPSWEDARKSWFTARWYNPAAEFVILDGDRWVAASCCAELSPGVCWYVQHTCVIREYRGKGLAIAVKALATEYARHQGATLLKANNHSENHPVLAISRKFGFQPQPGWFEMVKATSFTS